MDIMGSATAAIKNRNMNFFILLNQRNAKIAIMSLC